MPGSIYPYGHSGGDMFLSIDPDTRAHIINFEYFRPYFERASLPMGLAKQCLGHHYSQYIAPSENFEFVKFVKLSSLKTRARFPAYDEIRTELVDYLDIDGFALAGPMSVWGGSIADAVEAGKAARRSRAC